MAKKASNRRTSTAKMDVPMGPDSADSTPPTGANKDIGALATLEQVKADRAKTLGGINAAKALIGEQYQFYFQCKSCMRPAVYFTEDPRPLTLVEDHHWRAIYHDPTERYDSTYVWCQNCYLDGWNEEQQRSHCLRQLGWDRITIEGRRGFRIGGPAAKRVMALRLETPAPDTSEQDDTSSF